LVSWLSGKPVAERISVFASSYPALWHYQLYLAIHDIDHTKTKAMSPQTHGFCSSCLALGVGVNGDSFEVFSMMR
jgi:hypothetical protein